MPLQKTQSTLMSKYGSRLAKAAAEHAADPVEYSQFGELPDGIDGGIAQLIDCKFTQIKEGKQNAGELMFYAAGTVVVPTEHNGVPVRGLRTQISEPVFDTPTRSRPTMEDHIAWIQNELKKLLGPGDHSDALMGENLEATCENLIKAAPYFRFRTWKGAPSDAYPDPRVNHSWNGYVEYVPEEESGVEDSTPPPSANGTAKVPAAATRPANTAARNTAPPVAAPPKPGPRPTPITVKPAPIPKAETPKPTAITTKMKGGKPVVLPQAPPPPEPQPEPAEFDEFGDLNSIVAAANTGDPDAAEKLKAMAMERGVGEEEIDAATSWGDVLEMMEALEGETATSEEEGEAADAAVEEEWVPKLTEVYLYYPIVKGKKAAKSVEVEVTAVDPAKRTVDLKNLDNPKSLYRAVAWDALVGSE